MSNHFHLLLEVPAPPQSPLSDEELLERCAAICSPLKLKEIRLRLELLRDQPQQWMAYRQRFLCRMWDVSHFMKSLKQRFTQWFNGSRGPHRRKGTLWEERFKSVLVEGTVEALSTLAAYIDLNPIRAGLVQDPKDYRWSGYGAAMGGDPHAIEGLTRMAPAGVDPLSGYRRLVYMEGVQEGISSSETPVRQGIAPERVKHVLDSGGELSLMEALRCRVRYFCDGAVLGSRQFANEIFMKYRTRFGARRQEGAQKIRGMNTASVGGLFTLRDLRLRTLE
jgi:REP element-mobilizing transposase RayT